MSKNESSCPNCGYCPHCGRSNMLPYVVRPVWIPPYYPYPSYPQPIWYSSPQGTTFSSGAISISSTGGAVS